ncbi:MAG TPA: DUF4124 domain-containing protein [Burkholderiales bacterium]|nr:DUF4124 domain-containing protein [Burkholderiales bacterium]
MSTHLHPLLRAALAAALVASAPAGHAQMYRWLDANGSVTFSNQLPSNMNTVTDLTVVLENLDGTVPNDKRSAAPPRAADDTRRPTVADVVDSFDRGPANATPPRATVAPGLTEATRDPCLISADPKCIEKNKAAYVPGRGYSPGSVAVGSTSSASAGGAVGGGGPPKLTAPKASAYALPPGSEAPGSAKR